ncbi:MAG: DMT family transporter [Armatimonadota bacterium]|nr:DMT family transporter [Armatimonadota bacterium]MDR7452327.1 DMT family transporter [Armatimonadota bacterium]MDR7467782.1 DMT family transporter [Armatimonadota bacterium]MDR7494632.1 DMT family transporter [Armatimonadota bacterium]MDR7499692.1 DMT family transporter [Armatimonadota bacterium]
MRGELLALLAALAFALSIVYSRRFMVPGHSAGGPVAPEVGVFVSMLSNVVVFGGLAVWEIARGSHRLLTAHAVVFFVLGGVAGTFIGRNLAYQSVLRIGPSRSTAIRLSNTLFAVLVGLVFLRELPRALQLAGAALVTAGLWLVVSRERQQQSRVDGLGVLAALASAVAFAVGDSLRRAGLSLTPSPVLGAAIGASVAFLGQATWLSVRMPRFPRRELGNRDVLISALSNTAAILLLFMALQRSPVANVSALYNLQVLLVIFLSRRLLPVDEEIGVRVAVGSVTSLLGSLAILFG